MKKGRLTINCDQDILDLIADAAQQNNITMSAVAEMFLELINYVDISELKKTSPLPFMFNIKKNQ